MPRVDGVYQWIRAEGEGVYEIPVGPVHAGIIEPGHFRFQAMGEDVINLEERLGYIHKGIEKRFEQLSWEEGARLAGRVSGDTTVAHALAYCRAVEALAETDGAATGRLAPGAHAGAGADRQPSGRYRRHLPTMLPSPLSFIRS